jgi:hypothetical protein
MNQIKSLQFQVKKNNFTENRIEEVPDDKLKLSNGEILVHVDLFSFTSNNITYAVSGEVIRYWEFFPPFGSQVDGWGIIPVWGFANVIESRADNIPFGDRIFGYFPPATHLKMKPGKITLRGFEDLSEHRSTLPKTYNLYRRVLSELNYDRKFDRDRALFYPLYVTSFCLWDSLQENSWHGADQVIMLSASSKTSIGLAYGLHIDPTAPKSIGITSARNLEAVKNLGLYDQVLAYDQLDQVNSSIQTVIVDMSGNNSVLVNLHKRLGDLMKFTLKVGLTHWKASNPNEGIIKKRSKFFFAPSHIQKRIEDWGGAEFDKKTFHFLLEAIAKTKAWLSYKNLDGLDQLTKLYPKVCDGTVPADQGLIVKMKF